MISREVSGPIKPIKYFFPRIRAGLPDYAGSVKMVNGTEERIAEDWGFEEIISPALSAAPPNSLPEEFGEKVRDWAEGYGPNEE